MARKGRKKPRTKRTAFSWFVIFLLIAILAVSWWLWSCLYRVSPQFNFLFIQKNEQSLKILNGETIHIHPQDEIKILDISTSICFNRGIRLVSRVLDINALLHEKMPFSILLPERDIFNQYTLRVEVKHYNRDLGHVDMVIEPFVEDWLDKAERSIDRKRRISILERAFALVPEDKRIRDRLIEEYKYLKKWEQAALMLEEIASKKPDQKVLHDLLEVYEAIPNIEKVILVLNTLVAMDPDDTNIRLRLASTLEKEGRLKEAINAYEGALKLMTTEEGLSIYKILGFLYTETDQPGNAISSYLKAAELDKKDENLYYNLSFLYEKIGRKDQADLFLSKALALKAGDIEGRIRLAERLIEKGKLKEAEKFLTEVLEQKRDSMKALLLLTKIKEKDRDKKELKQVYQKILLLDQRNETVVYNLGILEYETGNLSKAAAYLKRFIKSHPKDRSVHALLFDIYRRQKKVQLAYGEAQILITLNPKELSYYGYIFEYLNNRGDYTAMIEVMNKGLKSHPKNVQLREYLILAYLKTGKEDLAIKELNAILKVKPKDTTLLLQLAKLEEKRGKVREALATYKKIMAVSPNHKEAKETYPGLLLQVARLEERQGRLIEASKHYREVMDISPDHTEAKDAYLRLLLQLAKIEEAQGQFKEALKRYQEIMDISPGNEEAEEAYLRLRLKVLPMEEER